MGPVDCLVCALFYDLDAILVPVVPPATPPYEIKLTATVLRSSSLQLHLLLISITMSQRWLLTYLGFGSGTRLMLLLLTSTVADDGRTVLLGHGIVPRVLGRILTLLNPVLVLFGEGGL